VGAVRRLWATLVAAAFTLSAPCLSASEGAHTDRDSITQRAERAYAALDERVQRLGPTLPERIIAPPLGGDAPGADEAGTLPDLAAAARLALDAAVIGLEAGDDADTRDALRRALLLRDRALPLLEAETALLAGTATLDPGLRARAGADARERIEDLRYGADLAERRRLRLLGVASLLSGDAAGALDAFAQAGEDPADTEAAMLRTLAVLGAEGPERARAAWRAAGQHRVAPGSASALLRADVRFVIEVEEARRAANANARALALRDAYEAYLELAQACAAGPDPAACVGVIGERLGSTSRLAASMEEALPPLGLVGVSAQAEGGVRHAERVRRLARAVGDASSLDRLGPFALWATSLCLAATLESDDETARRHGPAAVQAAVRTAGHVNNGGLLGDAARLLDRIEAIDDAAPAEHLSRLREGVLRAQLRHASAAGERSASAWRLIEMLVRESRWDDAWAALADAQATGAVPPGTLAACAGYIGAGQIAGASSDAERAHAARVVGARLGEGGAAHVSLVELGEMVDAGALSLEQFSQHVGARAQAAASLSDDAHAVAIVTGAFDRLDATTRRSQGAQPMLRIGARSAWRAEDAAALRALLPGALAAGGVGGVAADAAAEAPRLTERALHDPDPHSARARSAWVLESVRTVIAGAQDASPAVLDALRLAEAEACIVLGDGEGALGAMGAMGEDALRSARAVVCRAEALRLTGDGAAAFAPLRSVATALERAQRHDGLYWRAWASMLEILDANNKDGSRSETIRREGARLRLLDAGLGGPPWSARIERVIERSATR